MFGLFWVSCRVALLAIVLIAAPAIADDRPATVPLDSLRELTQWTTATAPWNAASEKLRRRKSADNPLADLWLPRSPSQDGRGQVIAMHDMAGGYAADQDRFPDGTDNRRLYRFTHWQYVDTFIYFSHHRVSFPPPGWTDSAHCNGVLSLGTFVIEGQDDPMARRELRELLDDPKRRRAYAGRLARLAHAYGFDGWLVNIETDMPGDADAQRQRAASLVDFVAELRTRLRRGNPHGTVIWYDSITRSGEVDYRNELDRHNAPFFDAADGITVNYGWSPPERDGSPEHSAKVAGRRSADVYSSVDAFCRQSDRKFCGFGSYLGARPAFAAGTSFGVFGPGWTYEGDGSSPSHQNFSRRDRRFWVGTEGDTEPRGGVAEFVAARPIPSSLPFSTSFDRGFGRATWRKGERIDRNAWGNVGRIDVLPTWLEAEIPGSGDYRAALVDDVAFDGGSSFRIGSAGRPSGYSLRPLFRTAFGGMRDVHYTVRQGGLDAALVVVAARGGDPKRPVILVLAPDDRPLAVAPDWGLPRSASVLTLAPGKRHDIHGWTRRSYDLTGGRFEGLEIGAIGVLAYPGDGARRGAEVHLGEISVR